MSQGPVQSYSSSSISSEYCCATKMSPGSRGRYPLSWSTLSSNSSSFPCWSWRRAFTLTPAKAAALPRHPPRVEAATLPRRPCRPPRGAVFFARFGGVCYQAIPQWQEPLSALVDRVTLQKHQLPLMELEESCSSNSNEGRYNPVLFPKSRSSHSSLQSTPLSGKNSYPR